MATDGFLPGGAVADFGPCEFWDGRPIPALERVLGERPAKLRGHLRLSCPNRPGVYGMLDEHGEVIYLGKARRLRTRLLSYFRTGSRPPKAGKILRQARVILWEVWGHEFAAVMRERELIRRWRPRWNVQGQPLRRRHAFLCLGRAPAPYVFLARQPPADCLAMAGPLPAGPRAREAARRLNDLFQLRDCPQPQEMMFAEQGELFAGERVAGCLRHEIGACLGPCAALCSLADYGRQARAARAFLQGTNLTPLARLETQMRQAAAAQQFESAAGLRDRWAPLAWLVENLERLRQAQASLSFVYPLTGWDNAVTWYLIHGARLVTALPAPRDAATADAAQAAIAQVFSGNSRASLLESYEHIDSRWLVMSWFRARAGDLKKTMTKTMTPAAALRRCRSFSIQAAG
jgi:excinuclease ABC subunit C